MIWYQLIIWVATLVIGELLRPKPRFDTPQPSSLGDFQVPTAEEGRAIPVIFGTCHVKGPNVTWYGDLKVVPITEKVKTGLFSSKRIIKGYKYFMGMQLSLCHGEDVEFISARWGDRVSTPVITGAGPDMRTLTFDDTDLYGGEEQEGGISGQMDFYFGTKTQTASSYLDAVTGAANPGYRTLCYAVMKGMYIGNSKYLKQNSFELRRLPNGLGLTGGKHNVNGDANFACAFWDALTNVQWGCGLDPSQLDIAAFTAVGNRLYDEGLGVSCQLTSPSSADAFFREGLRHIDGTMYADPETGLITIALARDDYDTEDLEVLDGSNCEEMEYSRGSWQETINTIRVIIVDRSQNYNDRPIPAQNLANVQARNGWIEPEDYDFKMIGNVTAGNKVAARVLKTVSSPLARMTTTINRQAHKYRPGKVVKVSWPQFGVTELVSRITNIDYGEYKDGKIRADLVEDIFHTAYNAFDPPSPSGWIKPTLTPAANVIARKLEVPYFIIKNSLDAGALASLTNQSFAFLMVQRPASQNHSFNVYDAASNVTANYNLIGNDLYTPTALLNGALAWNTTAINLDGFIGDTDDLTVAPPISLVLVDDEWMLVEALNFGTGAATVKRGVLDSIPVLHADNARVWLYFGVNGFAALEKPISKGTTRWYRETGVAIDGESSLDLALTQSHAHDQDWLRPYPPADVKVDGTYYPTEVPGNFTITWKGRNRLTQDVVGWTEAHAVPEAGTKYTLRVYDNDTSTLLATITNLVVTTGGGSYTYGGQSAVVTNYRIELEAVRDGLTSKQKFSHVAAVFGYGLLYDFRYGGSIAGSVLPRGTSSVGTGDQYRRVPVPTWINGNWHDFDSKNPMLSVDGGENWITEALGNPVVAGAPSTLAGSVYHRFGNGIYLAYNRSGTYWVRRDGGVWTQITNLSGPLAGAGNISAITFDGTRFLASMGNSSVYTATDPTSNTNWTLLSSMAAGYTLLGVIKIGAQYVAHASKDGALWAFTSPDAVTWTLVVTAIETGVSKVFWFFFSGHYFNGAYFVFGSEGPTLDTRALYGYRSTDGVTWTAVTLPSAGSGTNWTGTWALSDRMFVTGGDYIWRSLDGSTWTRFGVSRYSLARADRVPYFRGKGDTLAAENGPPVLLIYVPLNVEDGGKLLAFNDPTATPSLRHPTDGSVLNAAKFGSVAYEFSGFRAISTGEASYGKAVIARMSGKKYFEVTVEALPYGATEPITVLQVGVERVVALATSSSILPPNAGLVFANGSEYIPAVGHVIGVLADLDTGSVEIRVNNVLFKTIASLSTGVSFIPTYNAPRATVLANLGQSAFAYAVGGGYTAWDT